MAVLEGRYADALPPYRRFYEMEPDSPFSRWCYLWALAYNRQLDDAETILAETLERHPDAVFTAIGRSLLLGLRGERAEAVAALTPVLDAPALRTELFAREICHGYSVAGKTEKALDWLERAVELGQRNHPFLARHDWFLEGLRGHPRFQRVLDRVASEAGVVG